MAVLAFPWPPGGVSAEQLLAELQAANVPAETGWRRRVEGVPLLFLSGEALDELHRPAAQTVIDAHTPPQKRVPRLPRAIIADLMGLSGAQREAIRTDLNSGTPPKWQLSTSSVVWSLAPSIRNLPAGNERTEALVIAVAHYCIEHPTYLTTPPLGYGIPGDEVAP